MAEDRERSKDAMAEIGLDAPLDHRAHLEGRGEVQAQIGFPPSSGRRSPWAAPAAASPTTRGVRGIVGAGWISRRPTRCCRGVRARLEGVRDGGRARPNDNCIIICSIENFDPMGVHTGDSITVAPAQTLTDKEYQVMRDASLAVLRKIGVETGGSNVQFAVNPETAHDGHRDEPAGVALLGAGLQGDRLSHRQGRAKLAVGYTLDELPNEITGGDAGLVRADHRLRGHQDPALHLREVPVGQRPADHADEVGGRGDGDRSHLPGVLQKALRGWRRSTDGLGGDDQGRPRRTMDRLRSELRRRAAERHSGMSPMPSAMA